MHFEFYLKDNNKLRTVYKELLHPYVYWDKPKCCNALINKYAEKSSDKKTKIKKRESPLKNSHWHRKGAFYIEQTQF